ncbi:MAG: 5-(carboxyamino)imidazole ribonucleotide mutase [Treponema sp. CETP13]|nr:MAG: 5-(carboxyamino)imidazole ribonucleotide mutase [Treponema sp. CETP13]
MKVAIILGSKSDMPTMKKAADVLRQFGVDSVAFVISAHRSHDLLTQTIKDCEKNGCEVIIAGAGLAAHLPGVIAAMTVLPVIGVPLECRSIDEKGRSSSGLAGLDALFSIVQMPKQIPVATVGINNAANAAYLAVEILAIKYLDLQKKLREFRIKLADEAKNNGGMGVEL